MDLSQQSNENNFDLRKCFYDDKFESLNLCENQMLQTRLKNELINKQPPSELSTQRLRNKIHYLTKTNKQRCNFFKPMYGTDLQACIGREEVMLKPLKTTHTSLEFNSKSNATCIQTLDYEINKNKMTTYWSQTQTLSNLLHLIDDRLYNTTKNHETLDMLDRFIVYVPSVRHTTKTTCDLYEIGPIKLHVSNPHVSYYQRQKTLVEDVTSVIKSPKTTFNLINLVERSMNTQFPEKRLIQYDCGKLQTLANLLRNLFVDTHRVLIFTQMTRMLDILENFLNYHGYKYLRLDGSTSIEQRQCLMERFNNDKRIFCFILSTRSGGIGVNLTGADTVVFYDSDWNPTMDAQAQDRCHRIGQTRDVHIYRLVSEKTIEENILKKANQKRLLADMTIEGGCFTTALLKKHHITELFDEPSLEDSNLSAAELANAKNSNKPFSDFSEQEKQNSELEVIVENLPAKATISPNNKESAQFEAVINFKNIYFPFLKFISFI
jgi:SNF2 family DNA or RNA helicase